MLHDGHQFDVRVAHLLHVGNQLVGQFAIGEPAISFVGFAAPGAEVNFVNRTSANAANRARRALSSHAESFHA